MQAAELMDKYLGSCYARGLAERWIKNLRYSLSTFVRWWPEDKCIESITDDDVERYAVYLRRQPIADGTYRSKLRDVKALLAYGTGKKINEAVEIKLPKVQEPEIIPLSDQQLNQIYGACFMKRSIIRYRDYTIMRLMEETGMRIGEVLRMETHHINRKEGTIIIPITKTRKGRTVFLTRPFLKELNSYLEMREHFGVSRKIKLPSHVWLSYRGATIGKPISVSTMQERIQQYGDLAGIYIRVSSHTFRHTFAKNYLTHGGDILHLQKLLGHSSLEMVKRYVRLFATDVQDNYLKIMSRRKPMK